MVKTRRYTRRRQRGRGFLSALGSAAKGLGSAASKAAKGIGSKVKGMAQKRLDKKGQELMQQQEQQKLDIPNAQDAFAGLDKIADASRPPVLPPSIMPATAPPPTASSSAVDLAKAAAELNKAGFTEQAKKLADRAAKSGGRRKTRRKRRTHFQ